jgi:hypothetical protein
MVTSENSGETHPPTTKALLRAFVLDKISKEQLKREVLACGIDPRKFNSCILDLLKEAVFPAQGPVSLLEHQRLQRRRAQSLRNVISQEALLQIKKEILEDSYLQKPLQQFSIFRRTPEELSSTVNGRPHLIALFSAQYNVLCKKIDKVLSIKDLWNKMKKGSFEYKLSESLPIDVARCAHECLAHYLKTVIGRSLDRERASISTEKLSREVYGNIYGVFLLHEEYPL